MKDYSTPKPQGSPKYIEFKIDDDVFQAHPRVGAGILDDVMDIRGFGDFLKMNAETATREDTIALMQANFEYNMKLMQFLDTVLTPESAARFAERLRSVTEPIDKKVSQQVVKDLIEEYSKPHPTEPLSSTSNGHSGMSASSMVGAPVTE